MTSQTLLHGGQVIHGDRIAFEDVLIEGEKIAAVGKDLQVSAITKVVDCADKYIFPGVIDAHTHMGIAIKDGFSADDFASGSRAALHGGVTTIIDFTDLGDSQTLRESLNERLSLAQDCQTDYSFHVCITRTDPALLAEIPNLVKSGINSFKVFMTYRAAGLMLENEQVEMVAKAITDAGGLLLVHAEDDATIRVAKAALDSSSTDPFNHGMSRPAEAEAIAIKTLGQISEQTGCNIYIVHLSSQAGLNAASEYANLTLETCPQYLFFTEEDYRRPDGSMYIASPPLHQNGDCRALLDALGNRIAVLATDHCPFYRKDKPNSLPFGKIPNGIGGVETLLPVTLAHFISENKDLTVLARVLAENPARAFALGHRKGKIEPGFDADLCLIDPSQITTDWFDHRESVTDWDAYSGMPALFPEAVWRRGEQAVLEGKVQPVSSGIFVKSKAAGSDD
jgi:dihydropyrimidinase